MLFIPNSHQLAERTPTPELKKLSENAFANLHAHLQPLCGALCGQSLSVLVSIPFD